jgi:hypothetical protein
VSRRLVLLSDRVCRNTPLLILFSACLFYAVSPAATIDLSLNGQDYRFTGVDPNDYTGQAVAFADLNNDGRDDIVIAAPGFDYQNRGNCGILYVVIAGDTLPPVIDLGSGAPYIKRILGPQTVQNVGAVLSSGDVDGDGREDIVWGIPWASPAGRFFAGEVIVVYGSDALPDTLDLAGASSGFTTIYGKQPLDKLGSSLAAADLNGDSFDDVVMGAPLASPPTGSSAGELFILYGSASPPALEDLGVDQTGVSVVFGERAADTFGNSCIAKDLDGDGFADVIAGAPMASPFGRSSAGTTYMIFGSASVPDTLNLLAMPTGVVRILGPSSGALSGSAVCAGDLGGDGLPDAFLSAIDYSPPGKSKAGAVFVIPDAASAPDTIDLASSTYGISSVLGGEPGDHIGMSLASGDLNLDGKEDMLIGSPQASPLLRSGAGEVTIVFGRAVFPPQLDLASSQAGITAIYGASSNDYAGGSIATGDMNNDGFFELLVASRNARVSGASYAGVCDLVMGDPLVTTTTVVSRSAEIIGGDVVLAWETSEIVDPSSFRLARRDEKGSLKRYAGGIIEEAPAHYTFTDEYAEPGNAYNYEVSIEGKKLFSISVAVPSQAGLVVHPNYPNPFSSSTTIPFTLPGPGTPRITIYDIRGAEVITLPATALSGDRNELSWDGRNGRGEPVAAGTYVLRIRFGGRSASAKIMITR